jgi:hypothetical protein
MLLPTDWPFRKADAVVDRKGTLLVGCWQMLLFLSLSMFLLLFLSCSLLLLFLLFPFDFVLNNRHLFIITMCSTILNDGEVHTCAL